MRRKLKWLSYLAGLIQLFSGIGEAQDARNKWPGAVTSVTVYGGPPPQVWAFLRTDLPKSELVEIAHEVACRERRDATGRALSLPITVHLSILRLSALTKAHVSEDLHEEVVTTCDLNP
jgi:hypothetical protein